VLEDPLRFARLKEADVQRIAQACRSPKGCAQIESSVLALLERISKNAWIDSEALYILGRQLRTALPKASTERLIIGARAIGVGVADPLERGLLTPKPGERKKIGSPSAHELRRLIAKIEAEPTDLPIEEILALHERYVQSVERTGMANHLVSAEVQIATLLLKRDLPTIRDNAILAQQLIREGLRWAPANSRLWALWARSYVRQGALETAEKLYWVMIRRFPGNVAFRDLLVKLLRGMRDRYSDALRLAKENHLLFPSDRYVIATLAVTYSRSPKIDDRLEAIRMIAEQWLRRDYFFGNLLSRILVSTQDSDSDIDEKIETLLNALEYSKDEVSPLGAFLVKIGGSRRFAERLFRKFLAVRPAEPAIRNLLAKTLAQRGDSEGRDEAQGLLEETMAMGDLVYAPRQLASLLAESGDINDRKRAIDILGTILATQPDSLSIRNHLASIKGTRGTPRERQEALDWLRHARTTYASDGHSRMSLVRLLLEEKSSKAKTEAFDVLREVITQPTKFKSFVDKAIQLRNELVGAPAPPSATDDVSVHDDLVPDLPEGPQASMEPEVAVPDGIFKWANLRQLRAKLESDNDNEVAGAIDTLRQIREQDADDTYINILAERQAMPVDAELVRNSFHIGFERALREFDLARLDALAKTFPRYEALILVAKAVLGDATSQRAIDSLLAVQGSDDAPRRYAAIERIVSDRLRPVFEAANDFKPFARENRRLSVIMLRDMHEATLPGDELVAA